MRVRGNVQKYENTKANPTYAGIGKFAVHPFMPLNARQTAHFGPP